VASIVSGMGRAALRLGVDASIRRRIDVTRLFTQRPGERLTVQEVCEHTPGRVERVSDLLDELVAVGWLRTGRNEANRVVYWRGGERRS
jgi:hypothetical protein